MSYGLPRYTLCQTWSSQREFLPPPPRARFLRNSLSQFSQQYFTGVNFHKFHNSISGEFIFTMFTPIIHSTLLSKHGNSSRAFTFTIFTARCYEKSHSLFPQQDFSGIRFRNFHGKISQEFTFTKCTARFHSTLHSKCSRQGFAGILTIFTTRFHGNSLA